jgi:hypothetical protein
MMSFSRFTLLSRKHFKRTNHSLSNFIQKIPDSTSSQLRTGDNSYARLGRAYEEKCKRVMERTFDTSVKILGGSGDGGIDLLWKHSLHAEKTSISQVNKIGFIAQCKCKESGRVTPEVVRALEGTMSSFPDAEKIGCLISNHRATESAAETLKNSSFPLINFIISACEGEDCLWIKEIILNRKFMVLYPHVHVLAVRKQNLTCQTLRWRN